MGELGRDLTGIAMALIGVAFAALLIGRSSNTAQVISSATGGFNTLLQTVSLQNGSGVSMSMPGV